MKAILTIFLSVLVIELTNAQTPCEFVSGKVEFTIKNMGLNVNGTMAVTTIQFKQPSADPTTWSFEGSADPATIATGIDLRDKHLRKSDYFDVAKYPFITLQSTAIKPKGKNTYEGVLTLTLKGITQTVIVPFTIKKNGSANNVEGSFKINRLAFGLGETSTILADDVNIRVLAVFK